MTNEAYWRDRALVLEERAHADASAYAATLDDVFGKASASLQKDIDAWYQRFADNNEIDMAEARRLLNSRELKEFHWTVDEYIKNASDNADGRWSKQLENASVRRHVSRFEALQMQVQQHANEIAEHQQAGLGGLLRSTYKDQYDRTAFTVQQGAGVGTTFQRYDEKQLERVLSSPWAPDGSNFSARIWKQRDVLAARLQADIAQCIIRGENPVKKLADGIAREFSLETDFKAAKVAAVRLVHTEAAHIAETANIDSMKAMGVDEIELLCTLDGKTCGHCQDLDGTHMPIQAAEPGMSTPPFHPRCRCTICKYVGDIDDDDDDDLVPQRAARAEDGSYYTVPADMSYEQWQEQREQFEQRQAVTAQEEPASNAQVALKFAEYVVGSGKKDVDISARSGIMGIGGAEDMTRGIDDRGMANGLRKAPLYVLTEEEISAIQADAEELGIPLDVLRFNQGKRTGFRDKSRTICIRGDILPDLENGTTARDRMSRRAVLAHEYYGHYLSYPSAFEPDDWQDEFFASYNAAFKAPNLTAEERIMLVQDAYDRQKAAGAFTGYSEKARRLLYGD